MLAKSSLIQLSSFIVILLLLISSCEEKENKVTDPDILKLEELLKQDKSKQNELGLIGTIFRKAAEATDDATKELLFEHGVSTCAKLGYDSEKQSFISELLKCCYKSDKTPERLYELSTMLEKSDKKDVASIMRNALYRNFKSSSFAQKISDEDQKLNYTELIKNMGNAAFDAAGSTGLNREEAIKYIDLAEAFAMVDPRNAEAPSYLWKGAEMARNLGSVEKCLNLYGDLATRYPDYEKAPDALFVKGYILETSIGNNEAAGKAYADFVNKYPEHELADDAQFLLDNLGKTDTQLLESIQSKK